jgi:hypothetical protein
MDCANDADVGLPEAKKGEADQQQLRTAPGEDNISCVQDSAVVASQQHQTVTHHEELELRLQQLFAERDYLIGLADTTRDWRLIVQAAKLWRRAKTLEEGIKVLRSRDV